MEIIKTKNFDLAVYKKGNDQAKKLALVLPGRLDTKDYPHLKSHVDFLATKGYLALSFDPPGTWESPGDISLYTMTNYLMAINELIELFDSLPTLTIGHSRGGSMSLLTGTRNPHVTHFISIFGNYSYAAKDYSIPNEEEIKAQGYDLTRRDIPGTNPQQYREFKLPYQFFVDGRQYDVLEDLKVCKKPKLFILGKRDTTVKPELVLKQYQTAAEPKELYKLDSDHNYRHIRNLIEEVNRVIGFFLDNTP